MKRGKDAEKTMGPMFPRLHVNDTEKGGPRAPPRNKMALYEQLSIPSQRFSHGMATLNSSNTASVVPPALSIHGSGHERGMFFPLRLPGSTRSAEKSYDGYSDSNTSLAQLEQKKKLDEDDFMVPTLVQSEKGRDYRKHFNGMNGETISPSSPAYLGHSVHVQSTSEKGPKRTNITGSNLGQEGKSQNKENAQEQVAFGASSHHDIRAGSELLNRKCRNDVSNQPGRGVENGLSSILRRDSCSYNPVTEGGFGENKTHGSLPSKNVDKGDDASETSMVDSISCLDISPDDVVGIIGQKHFWKARKAIANQQRVFAVQVFELHRLMKVQKSIAGSPHLLIEHNACSGQPLQGSLPKKLSLEYGVKPSPRIVKHKDGSENPNPNMECSAENAFGNTSLSCVQNVSDPTCRTLSGNPLSAPVLADNKLNPCFNQLPGHQWLIPVMSPSEGLIYKPYPGHGFMGPSCGGCGPQGTNPMIGNFINPAYGVQASHHHYQEIGVPRAHPGGHGYFPTFGMPLVHPAMSGLSVEQANNFAGLGSHGQLSGDEATFTTQNQSSRNVPTQKKGVIASKGSELQGSTASSPAERGTGDHIPEGRNALSLFPTSPTSNIPEEATQLHDTEQPPRVIKVVPHHARSATESAARIFQSIQEERKSTTPSSLAYVKQSLGG